MPDNDDGEIARLRMENAWMHTCLVSAERRAEDAEARVKDLMEQIEILKERLSTSRQAPAPGT